MRHKVSKDSICPVRSNRGRKITFSRVVLSPKLHQHFKKTDDILGDDWLCPGDAQKVSECHFAPRCLKGVNKRRIFYLAKSCLLNTFNILSSIQMLF